MLNTLSLPFLNLYTLEYASVLLPVPSCVMMMLYLPPAARFVGVASVALCESVKVKMLLKPASIEIEVPDVKVDGVATCGADHTLLTFIRATLAPTSMEPLDIDILSTLALFTTPFIVFDAVGAEIIPQENLR